jgi:5-methylcytosine-specific restriction endonuclease McrA
MVKGEPRRYVRGHGNTRPDLNRDAERTQYRRQWATDRPETSYGFCWCGCGEKTEVARQRDPAWGLVQGEPKRYVRGHGRVRKDGPRTAEQHRHFWSEKTDVPYGYCWCGCGGKTSLALQSSTERQQVIGEPLHYLMGHEQRLRSQARLANTPDPNPSGICWCGCGEKVGPYLKTALAAGRIKGQTARFVRGHTPNTKLSEHRKVEMCCRYEAGEAAWALADEYRISETTVYGHLKRRGFAVRWRSGWTEDTADILRKVRNCRRYKRWRDEVVVRDRQRCCYCGHSQALHAHHLKPFSEIFADNAINSIQGALDCAELWDIENAITLCANCHRDIHRRSYKVQEVAHLL